MHPGYYIFIEKMPVDQPLVSSSPLSEMYGSMNHPPTTDIAKDDDALVPHYGSVSNPTQQNYKTYLQRWTVLGVFSWLSFLNNWLWITWSPLTLQVAEQWKVPSAWINSLSAVYMLVYIPLSFPALYFLNIYKLRAGLLLGGGWNMMGAVLRWYGGIHESYGWVYAGTVLCAMCQTLTLAMPPLISTLWFPDKERGLSTSLGVLANQLGAAVGLAVTIFVPFQTTATTIEGTDNSANGDKVDDLDTHQLEEYLKLQMILSGVAFLFVLVLVRSDQPPTPPSEAARRSHPQHQDEDETVFPAITYWQSIRLLLSTTSGYILCVVYGLVLGVLYALATFLEQIFLYGEEPGNTSDATLSWSEAEIGYLGASLILAGVVGSLVSGEYLDRQTQQQTAHAQSHRNVSIVLLVGSIFAMVLFTLSRAILPFYRCLAYLATGLLGCFLTGFISVGFEYGTAISYPADEAAVAGVMNVAAQIGGWALVTVGGRMMTITLSVDTLDSSNDAESFNYVLVATLVVAFVLLWTAVTAKSRRPISSSLTG